MDPSIEVTREKIEVKLINKDGSDPRVVKRLSSRLAARLKNKAGAFTLRTQNLHQVMELGSLGVDALMRKHSILEWIEKCKQFGQSGLSKMKDLKYRLWSAGSPLFEQSNDPLLDQLECLARDGSLTPEVVSSLSAQLKLQNPHRVVLTKVESSVAAHLVEYDTHVKTVLYVRKERSERRFSFTMPKREGKFPLVRALDLGGRILEMFNRLAQYRELRRRYQDEEAFKAYVRSRPMVDFSAQAISGLDLSIRSLAQSGGAEFLPELPPIAAILHEDQLAL